MPTVKEYGKEDRTITLIPAERIEEYPIANLLLVPEVQEGTEIVELIKIENIV